MVKTAVLSFLAGLLAVVVAAIVAAVGPARGYTRASQMPTDDQLLEYNVSIVSIESQTEIEN